MVLNSRVITLQMATIRDACAGIKSALGPNGVIAPGRYGIAGTPAAT
jgi:hypothetical protein